MRINIRLYGEMKHLAPGSNSRFTLTVEPGASLNDLLLRLGLPASGYTALVNGRREDRSHILKDGDLMVVFPELCGG